MSWRRISGLLLICNTLIPLILVLVVGMMLWSIIHDIKQLVSEPLALMNTTLSAIQLQVSAASTTLNPVLSSADRIQQEVNRLSQQIGVIPDNINVLNNQIAIPGLTQVKQVLRGNLELFRDLGTVASGLSALQGLREGIQQLTLASDRLVLGIQQIVNQIVGLVLVVSAIAIPWIVISYSRWVYTRLARGWTLLREPPREL